ncbi:5311_t:CDS:2 [Paraglomus brasilianum]|uniref:5311_t:CDS:1 n=1 Tax=Paraglomus brasilianum TaxID=144538 RepID=A0A9N9GNE4_9GLOM|nr:5311_t:CDS:2 [Paraglomus brasilianum]
MSICTIIEHVRLQIPSDVPLAVQQWQGLIAVNYAARKAGIQRHCTAREALAACPDLKLVHVATYANGEKEPKYHPNPSYATHKVSLDPYRRASASIFKIFQRFCNIVERASVDEAYMDVTDIVNSKLLGMFSNLDENSEAPDVEWANLGTIYENSEASYVPTDSHIDNNDKWCDWQLAVAAKLCAEIRDSIHRELGYTCSAGIAHNKTLAKLCSVLNKPNGQTVMRSSQTLGFMYSMPFQKIRNLGGKLGNFIEDVLQVETAGELWKFSVDELQAKFGRVTGAWLFGICRGIDSEEVVHRNVAKSMMAAKSFRPPVKNLQQIQHWATILGTELYTRVIDDFELNQRWPKNLVIHYRCISQSAPRSKSCPFPRRGELFSPDTISTKISALFKNSPYAFPCVRLAASATGLGKDNSVGMIDISQFVAIRRDAGEDTAINSDHKMNMHAHETASTEKRQKNSPESSLMKGQVTLDQVLQQNCNQTPQESESKIEDTRLSESYDKFGLSPGDIRRFFTNATASTDSSGPDIVPSDLSVTKSTNEMSSCDKCNKMIPQDQWIEHKDFHFALQLQREDDSGRKLVLTTNDGSKKKRKIDISNYFKSRTG